MKKFLVIPILIIIYIFFVNTIVQMGIPSMSISGASKSASGEVVRIGQAIDVSVRRPYFFGLIYLPVYIDGVGDIGIYHDTFFSIIFILTIALIIIEVKNNKEIKGRKTKRKRR